MDSNFSIFLEAAHHGNTREVLRLLSEGASLIQARTEAGDTAFILAAKGNHSETIEWLIKFAPNLIEQENNNGDSALMLAASLGHTETVSVLICHGAMVSKKNKQGDNALVLAAKNGHHHMVTQLMSAMSPYELAPLKQVPLLTKFISYFESQTKNVAKKMTPTQCASPMQPERIDDAGLETPKAKSRARKKYTALTFVAPGSSKAPVSRNTDYNRELPHYGFSTQAGRASESHSWRQDAAKTKFR